ncbi:MAG: response regulator [Steroidobacteraceae bacterium]|nr:response regulator [Deltaproteobacteria bacterium]
MSAAEISILLVDDDEMIRECICAYLEDEGFSVRFAASGEEALETIAAIRPTVCISDMRLPGMNGVVFIGKAHLLCPETGFMLHSGLAYSLSDELRAIGMTADDVFLKPIHELSTLIKRITEIAAAGKKS